MAAQTAGAAPTEHASGVARILPVITRVLMGLVFLMFGLNGFLHFLPNPKTLPEPVTAYLGALAKTGYMVPLIFATQTVVGVLLIIGRFVPLALTLIAPVIVNIIGFHIFLSPSTIAPGIVVAILEIYLVWVYRDSFRSVLAMRPDPFAAHPK